MPVLEDEIMTKAERQAIINEFEKQIVKFESLRSIFPFGKYKGKSLENVRKTDPFYLSWLFYTSGLIFNLSDSLNLELTKNFKIRLNFVVPFGKHKGKTIKKIIKTDIDYFNWFNEKIINNSYSELSEEVLDYLIELEDEN